MRTGCGTDAVIVRGDEVLLTHRVDSNVWVFPGGAVDPGESPWDAVIRETNEETGLTATVVRLLGVAWQSDVDEMIFDFLCSAEGEARPCIGETDAIEWFALDRLPPNLFGPHRERLDTYISAGWTQEAVLATQRRHR